MRSSFQISALRSRISVGLVSALLMALAVVGSAARPAIAAELIMFEQPGCPFCRAFDQEIAPDYSRSAAGKIAPLRRADIFDDRRGGIPGLTPAYFTPTFVVVDDAGQEVGRLEGYPGRKYFYPEIETIIEKLTRGKDAQAPDTAGRFDGTPASVSSRQVQCKGASCEAQRVRKTITPATDDRLP